MEISATCPSLGWRIAMTIVSVRVEPVRERRSEPMSRKLIVFCPLLKSWLSKVGCGAMVLFNTTASMVGSGVGVSGGMDEVAMAESAALVRRSGSFAGMKKLVAPRGRGWKGVGVAEGIGAEVTRSKSDDGWDGDGDAFVPHPASNSATKMICRLKFMARELLKETA